MKILLGRRDFLKQSALGAVLSLSQPAVWSASRQDLRRTDHPKKLIVVGAGMGGLAAAYQLVETGHDVTLLEARARPGGLVGTLREPFSDGLYADAGALFIPENHDIVLKYVKLFSLPLRPSFPQGLARVYCLQGRRFEVAEGEEPEWPLNLTAGERRFGLNGLRRRYVDSVLDEIGDPTAPGWPPERVKKFDRISFGEFLRQQGASPAAVTLLGLGAWNQWGDGVDTVSALMVLRGAALRRYARQFFRIDSGNDRLPRAFARQLGERIRYEAPVARIERSPQNVRVVFQKSGKHETMTADHVICAIPFSTLRHIEISPPLSPEKRAAIAELPYSSATRVFLQMRRKFWIDEGLSGWALTDLPISSISEAPANETGRRGILATYMSGAAARDFASLKEHERIERTLEQAEKIFPGTRQSFERGTSIAWDGIPWSRGAAPWMRPGQVTALLPHLARPEGRVHFAGEHTLVWMRWMQGALESGHRAAREVHEAT
jgi:monoamine oxidase